jgi:hypothetical protein
VIARASHKVSGRENLYAALIATKASFPARGGGGLAAALHWC